MEEQVQELRGFLFPNGVPFWEKGVHDLRYFYDINVELNGLAIEIGGRPGNPHFYVKLPTQPNGLMEMELNGDDFFPVAAEDNGNYTAIPFLDVKKRGHGYFCHPEDFYKFVFHRDGYWFSTSAAVRFEGVAKPTVVRRATDDFALPNLDAPFVVEWQLFGRPMERPILELSAEDMRSIAENLRGSNDSYVFTRLNGDRVLVRANADGSHAATILDLAPRTMTRIREHIAGLFGFDSKAVDPEDPTQFCAPWPLEGTTPDKVLQLPKKWVTQIAQLMSIFVHVLRPLDKAADVRVPLFKWDGSKRWLLFRNASDGEFKGTMPSVHGWEVAAPTLEIKALIGVYEQKIQSRTSSAIQFFGSTPEQLEELKRAVDVFLQFQRRFNAVESCITCGSKAVRCDAENATRAFCASDACVRQYFSAK